MKTCLQSILCFIVVFTSGLYAQMLGTGIGQHSIAVRSDGTVYTWGSNWGGALGTGNSINSYVPVPVVTSGVLSGKIITQVAAGWDHFSVALSSDGKVFTWGYNNDGQLGNVTHTGSSVPVAVNMNEVMAGKTIVQIAVGFFHCMALSSDGKVFCWGYDGAGQLGNGPENTCCNPTAVDTTGVLSGKTIVQIAAGGYHSVALASDGTVYSWGYNSNGQLGHGTGSLASNVPVAVLTSGALSGKTIVQIAAGAAHTLALASDGTLFSWGANSEGQLGNGTNTNSNAPVEVVKTGVLSGKTITQIEAGGISLAVTSDGGVYTWGGNSYGELGDGTFNNSNVPVAVVTNGVLSGKIITQAVVDVYHSLALASDGSVYAWGSNGVGRLGNGNNSTSNVPVAVVLDQMGPLPVELTFFNTAVNGNEIRLSWETATESNNLGFEVGRRLKTGVPQEWQVIGFVPGNGTSIDPIQYTYQDKVVIAGTYQYRLKQIDNDGSSSYSGVVEVLVGAPTDFTLSQNYPNPFNPTTSITFDLPVRTGITLTVFNSLGEPMQTLATGTYDPGRHQVSFNASNLPSGIYFYRLRAGDFTQTQKMVLMR